MQTTWQQWGNQILSTWIGLAMYQIRDEERKVALDRRAKFRGCACIRLEFLHFEPKHARDADLQEIERLRDEFRRGACLRRLGFQPHVDATIDQQDLNRAIRESGTSVEELLKPTNGLPPSLDFPPYYRLECHNGFEPIEAARDALSGEDRWWIVDLYVSGKNPKYFIL
jgi:hypothetical protein